MRTMNESYEKVATSLKSLHNPLSAQPPKPS